MTDDRIENIEIDLLIEAVYRRYGYDFRGYSKNHILRRVRQFAATQGDSRISSLLPEILHNEDLFEGLLRELSITYTEMFRNPFVFKNIREKVIPWLRTYPFIRIWVAGCATGEEAFSLAILLKEVDLYERSTIFATDFNDAALKKASEGIFALNAIRKYTENYQAAGGTGTFSEYYHAKYDNGVMASELKRNIVFANHNLVTDAVFSEMHLILCRNVLIYFDTPLQNQVLGIFADSLVRGGFLCLGTNEDLNFLEAKSLFDRVDSNSRIFQMHVTEKPHKT